MDKKYTYVKGGKKLGIYNGDVETGTYIDIKGNFISPEGFALNEDGTVKLDPCGTPVYGDTPSYIPINKYEYDGIPWISEYKKKLTDNNVHLRANQYDDNELLIKTYFDLFKIKLDLPDEILTSRTGFSEAYRHHKATMMTVQFYWTEVFREGE